MRSGINKNIQIYYLKRENSSEFDINTVNEQNKVNKIFEETNINEPSEYSMVIPSIDDIYKKFITLIKNLNDEIKNTLDENERNTIGYFNDFQIAKLRKSCKDSDSIFSSINMKINNENDNDVGNHNNENNYAEAESILSILMSCSEKIISLDDAKELVNFKNLISESTNVKINEFISGEFSAFDSNFQNIVKKLNSNKDN